MWDELKHILRSTHDKAIIVEDGKPRYVVMSVEEYSRLQGQPEGQGEERSYEEANEALSSIEVDEEAKGEARGAIDLNDLPL